MDDPSYHHRHQHNHHLPFLLDLGHWPSFTKQQAQDQRPCLCSKAHSIPQSGYSYTSFYSNSDFDPVPINKSAQGGVLKIERLPCLDTLLLPSPG
mmetsp:Transcript_49749/g.105951  ORF Transcript_49749/g.105951 Transcript_49749/m.105951 type:complete len:95 (+) Transcript_49749:168-452(+)